MDKFSIGKIFKTNGIATAISNNIDFAYEIFKCFLRYINCDWGNLCEEDKLANEYALEHNERILGAYKTTQGKIYIITEWNREITTIMFANEY